MIERSEYKINGASNSGYIIVKDTDLDELEQQAAILEDDSPEGHKVTNQQYINVLAEKQKLEAELESFKHKLSSMAAHRNALNEEILGLQKYINKLHKELNKSPLFKKQPHHRRTMDEFYSR